MSRTTRTVALVAVGAVVIGGLGVGYVAANVRDLVPGPFTTAEPWPTAEPYPIPTVSTAAAGAPLVPEWSESAPVPTAAQLQPGLDALLADPAVGPSVGAIVIDAATGETIVEASASQGRVPASTTKILTGIAAVATLDLASRLSTTAQLAPDGTLYLVGAGDMTLSAGAGDPSAVIGHGGIADLAAETATELEARGLTSVSLVLDDTLFAPEARAPGWGDIDFSGGHVAPIQALGIEIGKVAGQTRRSEDPALAAATAFADALRAQGLEVSGPVTRAAAPADAVPIGEVTSAPLGEILDVALEESSNTLTEVFGRLVALAEGEPPTFEGATRAVLSVVADLGVDVSGTSLSDASGLSSRNSISPRLLAEVLEVAFQESRLRPFAVALPIAGLQGTLVNRSLEPGVVRAKTGTLVSVVSLAGYAPTADGRLLVFAVMADDIPYAGSYAARLSIDTWVDSLLG